MIGGRIALAIGARLVRAVVGELPTQAELDKLIAEHPMMTCELPASTTPKR